MIRYWFYVLACMLMVSACTPPVVFDQPYPLGEDDLIELPSKYTGTFICESDSNLLIIDKHEITLKKENFFLMPLKDVEERPDCTIDGDEMYVEGREECIPLEFVNDSIVKGFVEEYDTLFVMSKGSVARMYNGHVVLSKEMRDGQWAVSLLSLEENSDVTYRAITDKTKIKNIGRITAMENITTTEDKNERYKIKPTMKQFDELLQDKKVFIECEYLTRVIAVEIPAQPIIIQKLN
ncbi:MAG: hypothetical protein AAGA77_16845 [Bacteroidota bacterium]